MFTVLCFIIRKTEIFLNGILRSRLYSVKKMFVILVEIYKKKTVIGGVTRWSSFYFKVTDEVQL